MPLLRVVTELFIRTRWTFRDAAASGWSIAVTKRRKKKAHKRFKCIAKQRFNFRWKRTRIDYRNTLNMDRCTPPATVNSRLHDCCSRSEALESTNQFNAAGWGFLWRTFLPRRKLKYCAQQWTNTWILQNTRSRFFGDRQARAVQLKLRSLMSWTSSRGKNPSCAAVCASTEEATNGLAASS